MELTPGAKLGPYEIVSPIGAGGMGEVFKALDTRLDRTVAVKVMPKFIAAREDLRARFEREARTVSSLNHPNICVLFDIGKHNGTDFMVLEYLEGETLGARISRGPIPLDQVLKFATQIADALDRAHRSGVSHRDVKPANVMITRDGCKVLDFGLAKTAPKVAGPDDATLTALTSEGAIMGTPQYMAPEQYEGREADARSDIFAFGCVLYEMVTGKRAFSGKTKASLIAAVLGADPAPMSSIQPVMPRALDRLVTRCLAKDPEDRWQSMRDVVLELRSIALSGSDPVNNPVNNPRNNRWLVPGMCVFAIAAAVLAFVVFREAPPATPFVQTEMPLPDGVFRGYSAISPDGTRLAVVGTPRGGRPQLYLRTLGARAFAPVPATENAGLQPFWSPDSQWIAFGADGKLMKWNVTSGQPRIICNADVQSGSWSEDGIILFSEDHKPIQRVPAAGGTPRNALELNTAFGEESQISPHFLPGGRAFLFQSNGKVRGANFFATLDGKVRRHLFDNLNSPNVYVANPSGDGFLAYIVRSQLFARPFNPTTGEFIGEAVLLLDGVVNGPYFSFGGAGYLAYAPTRVAYAQLRWYGGDGKPGETSGDPGELSLPRISPDGKSVADFRLDSGKGEIWLTGEGGASERIASGTAIGRPIWTPDGRILYIRNEERESIVVERPADALGAETALARIPGSVLRVVQSISANGKVVALTAGGGGKTEVYVLSLPEGKIRPANFPPLSLGALVSPDGRWLAYVLGPTPFHVFVRAIPDNPEAPLPSGERELASIPAMLPLQVRWSPDGKAMLFLAGPTPEKRTLMLLPINWSDGTPRPGALRKLFDVPRAASFDVSTDGQRFIVAEALGDNTTATMVLIQNWPALLHK